jgi:Dolichyl-phosphate-mannose-protein mannosyltransferase
LSIPRQLAAPTILRTTLLAPAFNKRALVLFLAFAAATFFLRVPTFFEPAWHDDEGTFAAVAQKLLSGGELYTDAWESKPPLFLYAYAGIFKLLGAGILQLRVAAAVAALASTLGLFVLARQLTSERQALIAALVLTLFLAVPFWDGNLASAELFSLSLTILGVLAVVRYVRAPISSPANRASAFGDNEGGWVWLVGAGLMFGLAALIRQTAALPMVAAVAWLALSGRDFLRPAMLMALGGVLAVVPVVAAFAALGSFHWFWDANVGFFISYLSTAREVGVSGRSLMLLPFLVTVAALYWYRSQSKTPRWALPALWLTIMLAGALVTGRPYEHYLIPVFPPLALLVAITAPHMRLSWRPTRGQAPAFAIVASVALLWVTVLVPEFDGDPLAIRYSKDEHYYYQFAGRVLGTSSEETYNDYFDERVERVKHISATLDTLGARGKSVYVFGEYSWVYALSGTEPAWRYTSSFNILQIQGLAEDLEGVLTRAKPAFIVVMDDSWPRHPDPDGIMRQRFDRALRGLDRLLGRDYEPVVSLERAHIYRLVSDRSAARPVPDPVISQ